MDFCCPNCGTCQPRAFVLAGVVLSLYPQSADTHHDRIMNPTAAVVTPVCSLAPRLFSRCDALKAAR